MSYVLIALIAALAAAAHTATGLGYAIIGMSLWSLLIPFKTASIVEIITVFFINIYIAWRLRKHIHFKLLVWPFLGNLLFDPIGVYALMSSTDAVLKLLLGIALAALSVYLVFFEGKVRLRATPLSGFTAGAISGFCVGLFNIGGPFIAAYFISVTEDKRAYNSTIQCYSILIGIYTFILHFVAGNFTGEAVRTSAVALCGVVVGVTVGFAVFKKLTMTVIKKVIYVFMAVISIYLIISVFINV